MLFNKTETWDELEFKNEEIIDDGEEDEVDWFFDDEVVLKIETGKICFDVKIPVEIKMEEINSKDCGEEKFVCKSWVILFQTEMKLIHFSTTISEEEEELDEPEEK